VDGNEWYLGISTGVYKLVWKGHMNLIMWTLMVDIMTNYNSANYSSVNPLLIKTCGGVIPGNRGYTR
jgi:hypothetical protein